MTPIQPTSLRFGQLKVATPDTFPAHWAERANTVSKFQKYADDFGGLEKGGYDVSVSLEPADQDKVAVQLVSRDDSKSGATLKVPFVNCLDFDMRTILRGAWTLYYQQLAGSTKQ